MAKDFKVIGPGGEKPAEEEQVEDTGCPYYRDARCGFLDRTIESLMGDDDDGGDELEEDEYDED